MLVTYVELQDAIKEVNDIHTGGNTMNDLTKNSESQSLKTGLTRSVSTVLLNTIIILSRLE